MNKSIKSQIATLMILVALLPIVFILVFTMIQRASVDTTISTELEAIAQNNLGQIAKDVRAMLATSNDLIIRQIEGGQNTVNSMMARQGVKLDDATVRWSVVNQSTKTTQNIDLPKMLVGGEWFGKNYDVAQNTPLVDEVKQDLNMICTVFQRMNDRGDLLRIATNVSTKDGKRAIGTYIPAVESSGQPNPVVSTVMRGDTYVGPAFVIDAIYLTSYAPIRDGNGKVIGAISVAVKQEAVESIRKNIMDIKIGQTGYVYVLNAKGADAGKYVISLDGARDGENIWEARDSDGRLFIQSVVERALKIGNSDNIDFEYYPWLNEGDTTPRLKIAAISYYEPWDWVIGASAYMDEFTAAQREASASLSQLVQAILITGLIGIVLATVISIWFGGQIAKPIRRVADVAKEVARGNLTNESNIVRKDEIGQLASSMDVMMESLRSKAEVAERIAAGDLEMDVPIASEDDVLGISMSKMKDTITNMLGDVHELIDAVQNGDLKTRGETEKFTGGWSDLVRAINDLIEAFVKPIMMTSEYVEKIALGDIPEKIEEEYRGDFNVIKNNLNFCIDAIDRLVVDTKSLVNSAIEGQLETRADPEPHKGDYKAIVSGINQTLDAVIAPVQEAQAVLEKMAAGDLSDEMKGQYKGDYAKIKNALNGTLSALNDLLYQVDVAADQVNSGAGQVSSASQALSQGATEQASSLEETSSSMMQVGSQTKLNAENAAQANQLSNSAKSAAEQGNAHMKGMLDAMQEINEKSAEVQKIVKAIDDIAFQTNLLALNAAVEAARAGVHGKGFAVVAEEVRNLAQRSATAAKETTDLIDSNVQSVDKGAMIADKTAQALGEITEGVTKVSDLIDEIASASKEQDQAVEQITEALGQIDQVTQSNTASAEESAAASEELSGQAEALRRMLKQFTLKHTDHNVRALPHPDEHRAEAKAIPAGKTDKKSVGRASHGGNEVRGTQVKPSDVINLDDTEFDDF